MWEGVEPPKKLAQEGILSWLEVIEKKRSRLKRKQEGEDEVERQLGKPVDSM